MRYPLVPRKCRPLKSFLEWTTLGIFLIILIAAFMVSYGNDWQSGELERLRTADYGDIETMIVTVSTGSSTGGGVVWGTVQPNRPEEVPVASAVPAVPAPAGTPPPLIPDPAATSAAAPATASPLPAPPLAQPTTRPAPGRYMLRSSRQRGSTDLVETLLEVAGEARQITSDNREARERLEVIAGFRYEERVEQFSLTGQLVSVRQYNLARSQMRVGDHVRMPELPSQLQTIVGITERDRVTLFSPHGSLRGEQLLLIEDLPGNTLTIDRLLPNRDVAIGESWKIDENVLRSFLSVDAVLASNVEAVLTAVADNMAMIEILGDISGIYLGAMTEMSVRAQFQFDLSIQRINWLGAVIEENRAIGHVGPGVELIAKLQVKISPLSEPQSLTDEVMRTISIRPNHALLQLQYDGGRGPWRFSHDRNWYVYQDEAQSTVVRKLVDGELVAQCNVADMGTVDLANMTTLARFQQDLITGLGQNFGRVVGATEFSDARGNRLFRVMLDGMVDDLALRWIYYLVTDRNGRQAVVVFVVEAAMLDQFANTDAVLLESFRLGR